MDKSPTDPLEDREKALERRAAELEKTIKEATAALREDGDEEEPKEAELAPLVEQHKEEVVEAEIETEKAEAAPEPAPEPVIPPEDEKYARPKPKTEKKKGVADEIESLIGLPVFGVNFDEIKARLPILKSYLSWPGLEKHGDLKQRLEARIAQIEEYLEEEKDHWTTPATPIPPRPEATPVTPEAIATTGKKKESPQEKMLKGLDPKWTTPEEKAVQAQLEEARKKYAEAYKKFWEDRKKNAGMWGSVKISVIGEKIKDADVPPELKALEAEYDRMAVVYGQQMFDKKKEELEKEGLSPKDLEDELKAYKQDDIFSRVIVAEQAILNGLKAENLPPKERNIAKKLLDSYLAIKPGWKRYLISTALATGVFASFFGTASVAGAVGVGAYAGKRFARAVAGGQMAQFATKTYDLLFKDKSTAEKRKLEEQLSKTFAEESFDTSLAKSKKEYASIIEREKNAKRKRLVTKAMIGVAAGGLTAWGLPKVASALETGDIPGVVEQGQTTPPTLPGVTIPPTTNAELIEKFGLNPDGTYKGIELPDPSDHSPQAEEMRRVATSFGIHDTPPPQGPSLETHPIQETEGIGDAPAEELVPGAGHELINDFSLKLGENGVPKNLETVFHGISADHMDLPEGGKVGEEFATKSLNMAANLVRLSEHHDVAGIDADKFAEAASFQNGILEIKNHTIFNEILGKLQAHSEELWDKGTLQGQGAAITYIPKISQDSWLKIVHAEGLHETVDQSGATSPTGILGHQEVTAEDITKFDDSTMVKQAVAAGERATRMTELKTQVIENIDKANTVPEIESSAKIQDMTAQEKVMPRGQMIYKPKFPSETGYELRTNLTFPSSQTGYELRTNLTRGVMDHATPSAGEILKHASSAYESTLNSIFTDSSFAENPEVFKKAFSELLKQPAKEIIEAMDTTPVDAVDKVHSPLFKWIDRIHEVLGEDFEPKGRNWLGLGKAETTEAFIKRATEAAALKGPEYLSKLTLGK